MAGNFSSLPALLRELLKDKVSIPETPPSTNCAARVTSILCNPISNNPRHFWPIFHTQVRINLNRRFFHEYWFSPPQGKLLSRVPVRWNSHPTQVLVPADEHHALNGGQKRPLPDCLIATAGETYFNLLKSNITIYAPEELSR